IARKRGEIYGTVLHDINNPLTVISSLAIMASEQLDQVSAPPSPDLTVVKEQLGQIEKQVGRCLDISKRYLGFARRQPGETPVVRLNQVLADLGMLLKCHPVLAANEFRVKPPAEEILVQINGTDLIQILLNLSINALQSTVLPHRVRVSTQLRKDPLALADFPDGPSKHFFNRNGFANQASLVQISVQDNGPGITVVPMERIFEPFFTTKSTGQGTGLGLTIVLHLVEHAHAGLYVETWPSQGATFALFLPAQPGPG
ncbi:MAG: HAMP domain-containing sensor histidine kinase, partial [Verrucomicrobia bacterium]|nr:HAMP domain-containing sensor histidine kinase [Verrucomicrobiota bacterium]